MCAAVYCPPLSTVYHCLPGEVVHVRAVHLWQMYQVQVCCLPCRRQGRPRPVDGEVPRRDAHLPRLGELLVEVGAAQPVLLPRRLLVPLTAAPVGVGGRVGLGVLQEPVPGSC